MNPAKIIQKNSLKFADDNILPLWMNQAITIQKNPLKFVYDPTLPLWMNQAKTIWKNSLKLQMTLFCRYRCIKLELLS